MVRLCTTKGCEGKYVAKGLCRKCYDKIARRKWYKKNKDYADEYQKKYREKNRKKINEAQRKSCAKNPEKYKEYTRKYRAKKRSQSNHEAS